MWSIVVTHTYLPDMRSHQNLKSICVLGVMMGVAILFPCNCTIEYMTLIIDVDSNIYALI